MSERFGWARFGDVNGGHNLIDANGIESDLLSDIRWHTDLPPAAPSEWPAFFAGYPIGDQYVVQFTQPDTQASRPGMVATTLVTVGLSEVGRVALATLRRASALISEPAAPPHRHERIDGLGAVLNLLAGSGPAYWVGDPTFGLLVDQLWEVLNAEDRAALVFGALFTPTSIPYPLISGTTHGVYRVPEHLRSRFQTRSIVSAANPPVAGEPASDILAGRTGIAADLGIETPSLRQWLHLSKANRYYNQAGISNPDELRSCAHLVMLLAPEPEDGLSIKQRLGTMIVESSASAPFSHIRGLRSIELDDLGVQLRDAIDPWADAVIRDPNRIDDLEAALAETAVTPSDPLSSKLEAALAEQIAASGQAIMGHFDAALTVDNRAVFAALARHLDRTRGDLMLASVSAIGSRDWTHEIARLEELPLFHASSCPTDEPIGAFSAHLSISGHSAESCARLAARCRPQHVVSAACALGAPDLIPLAARAALQDVDALLPAQPANRHWLDIWAHAVDGGADPWIWLQPEEAVVPVIDALMDGNQSMARILTELSKHDDIDLATYPRRTEAWGIIQEPARSRLLRRTAVTIVLEGTVTDDLEPALRSAVLSADVMARAAASDVSAAIDALETLAAHANSDIAKAVVKAADLGVDADRFADLIVHRSWTGAARYVIRKAPDRPDLASIEGKCRQVFLMTVVDWFDAMLGRYPKPVRARLRNDTLPGTLDALIVTAIQIERKAVRKHLEDWKSLRHKKITVDVGTFEGGERTLRVGVIEVGQGNIGAATITTMAVEGLQPQIVLMVGVAGGVKDVDIGDVVASSKIYWAESGKSEADHEAPRPDHGPVSQDLVQVARDVAADDTWKSRRLSEADAASAPKAIVAPIVAGERVVGSRDSADARRIKETYGDAVAVDMEDMGVATAADWTGSKCLAIRAISDLLDGKAEADAGGSQPIAAANAAAFAFELLARFHHSTFEDAPFDETGPLTQDLDS
ncbi:hypothetical protein [Candidatus Poriferisodalis sp.]|uniref:phosphorylase family protein n=1 Tax=Candidatus Poriferisodalis sp. TaxID=3101277 RepID=UPI003C6FA2A0